MSPSMKDVVYLAFLKAIPAIVHQDSLIIRSDILPLIYEITGWSEGTQGTNSAKRCRILITLERVLREQFDQSFMESAGHGKVRFTEKGFNHYTKKNPDDMIRNPVDLPLPEPEKIQMETTSIIVMEVANPLEGTALDQSIKASPCFGKFMTQEAACENCLLRIHCCQHTIDLITAPSSKVKRTTNSDGGYYRGLSSKDLPCSKCGNPINKNDEICIPMGSVDAGIVHSYCI